MEKEPVKVLYFVDRMLRGGIQSLVIDWVTKFDKEKIHVDFLLLDDGNKYELEEALINLGCKVYKLKNIWVRKPIDFIKLDKALNEFFKLHHDYNVVHLHSTSKNYMVLKYAKKYGIPVRIAHSHNIEFQTKSLYKKTFGNILKPKLIKYATDYFACSKLAGEWLFGKEIVKTDKFKVIHNAVEYDKFKFNKEARNIIRTELKVSEDCILFGNIGRFTNQKNHTFLIDIFNEIHKMKENTKLILIGIGENEVEIKEKVKKLKLEQSVIFAGFKNNVNEYMSAIDVFLMPSLYEGLPVVGVEAQAAGLPCFMSKDVITSEVQITSNLKFISLNISAKDWAEEILNSDLERKDTKEDLKREGYFIKDTINELMKFYSLTNKKGKITNE